MMATRSAGFICSWMNLSADSCARDCSGMAMVLKSNSMATSRRS